MTAQRDEILQAASNGNAAALEFLRAFATRAHWVDDLYDEILTHRELAVMAAMESEWLLTLSGNPFFLANRAALVPAMLLALNAWVDSEDIRGAKRGSPDFADVVKGQWHEVVWLVAWLTGGWRKMREVSGKYRSYDFEPASQSTINTELSDPRR